MSKKALIATLAGTFAAGGVVSLFISAHVLLPAATKYKFADPQYIQLDDQKEPVSYGAVSDKRYLGNLYLRHPLLFYKRQEGKRILADLANRGYTPAAKDIYHGIMSKADFRIKYKIPLDLTLAEKVEMYKWAMVAAEQGDPSLLFILLKVYDMGDFIDTNQHIKRLESLAEKSQLPMYAEYLAQHHTNQNNPKKTAYWAQVAADIKASPFTEPACTTITPWRGY